MESHVLVVDDDPIFNMMAKVLLKNSGITENPCIFSDGKAALSYLESIAVSGQQIVLFLDINMPVVSGWDVLNYLQAHPLCNQIQVVMVTSSIDNADKKKAMSYPLVIDFLVKPLKLDSLENVKHLLTGN
ncbi:Response regulator receiver domain-containing protein [bacterium A37T11]|nr:Response regulator receiver domain-containing protein [bacterium A37T11]